MNAYLERRATLQRMVAAASATRRNIEQVRTRIERQATDAALGQCGNARAIIFRSVTSYWSKRDHANRAAALAALEAAAGNELGALKRRLERQLAAIAGFARRHGINEEICLWP